MKINNNYTNFFIHHFYAFPEIGFWTGFSSKYFINIIRRSQFANFSNDDQRCKHKCKKQT